MRPFRVFGEAFASLGRSSVVGIAYQLYDRFDTARSAGAVNGTPAEPTGQTRTVTDTNSKLSITGGVISVATGGAAAGDPGLWYPQMTRQVGLLAIGVVVLTTNGLEFGWDSAQSGNILFSVRFVAGSALAIRDGGAAFNAGPTLNAATTYQACVILRGTGAWFFIKGGAFTNWTLIWIGITNSGNLFPAFTQSVGTTDVYTVDNIRVPVPVYIPLPLAYDTFTRSNGALGSTETTGPDSQVLTALAYVFTTGVWTIASNVALGTPGQGADVIVNGTFAADANWNKGTGWSIAAGVAAAVTASADLTQSVAPLTTNRWYQVIWTMSAASAGTCQVLLGTNGFNTHSSNATYTECGLANGTAFLMRGAGLTASLDNISCTPINTADLFSSVALSTADVIAEVGITMVSATSSRPCGLVLNLDSTSNPQNFVLVYLDGKGSVKIDECVAGSYTTKQSTAVTYSAGAILRVVRDGTECRVFYNNAAVGNAQTMTANTSQNHGLFSTHSSNTFDNLLIWPRGKNNEYSTLAQY